MTSKLKAHDLRLDFLGVSVAHFQKSRKFYTETLGIKEASFYPEWGDWAGLGRTWQEHNKGKVRGLMMELFGSPRVTPGKRKWGHGQGVRPSIQVAELRKTVARLRRRGVEFSTKIQRASWGEYIEFIAPEQIRWTLAYSADYPSGQDLNDPYFGWVELKVRDMGISRRFYVDEMGMRLKQETANQVILGQGRGEALLMLEAGGGQSPQDAGWPIYSGWGQPVWISFSTRDIKSAAARLKRLEVKVIQGLKHHPDWGGSDINIMDPDGNRIQVVQY